MLSFDLELWHLLVAVGLFLVVRRLLKRRREPAYYGQTMGEPGAARRPEPAEETPPDPDAPEMSPGTRVFLICFLSLWLIGWTFGIVVAARQWWALSWGEDGSVFLLLWLTFATPFWFLVAFSLVGLATGRETAWGLSFDGDGYGDGDGGGDGGGD